MFVTLVFETGFGTLLQMCFQHTLESLDNPASGGQFWSLSALASLFCVPGAGSLCPWPRVECGHCGLRDTDLCLSSVDLCGSSDYQLCVASGVECL